MVNYTIYLHYKALLSPVLESNAVSWKGAGASVAFVCTSSIFRTLLKHCCWVSSGITNILRLANGISDGWWTNFFLVLKVNFLLGSRRSCLLATVCCNCVTCYCEEQTHAHIHTYIHTYIHVSFFQFVFWFVSNTMKWISSHIRNTGMKVAACMMNLQGSSFSGTELYLLWQFSRVCFASSRYGEGVTARVSVGSVVIYHVNLFFWLKQLALLVAVHSPSHDGIYLHLCVDPGRNSSSVRSMKYWFEAHIATALSRPSCEAPCKVHVMPTRFS